MGKFGVGASLQRKEDARHLHGTGQFVADLRLPGTHELAFVRSGVAHGRIRAIERPAGAQGRVFVAGDLPEMAPIRAVPEVPGFKPSVYPPLATDKVRFVGEAIAVCVATTRAAAEDLAQATRVEIEPLPPLSTAENALKPGAALLHEAWGDNLFIASLTEAGDLEAAAKQATVVIEREYRMNRQAGVPLEGRAALAHWDSRLDELVLYSSTQFPHQIRAALAQILAMPEHQVHVIAPDVGGGFGIKNVLNPEEVVVAALGRRLRHPVRWIDDIVEHLLSSVQAREHAYKIKAYADSSGLLLGLDAEIMVDAGAYSHWPNSPFMETGMAAKNLPGPYRIRSYRAKTFTVATNKAPIGPYRGVARPGACFAIERTIDEVARAVGREPHEVRMLNMVTAQMMPYRSVTDLLYDNGDYPQSVVRAARLVDVAAVRQRQQRGEEDGRRIGLGFASYTEQTAHGCGEWVTRGTPVIPGFESATARLLPDGTLMLLVGIQSHGQGLETTLAQIAHEELGIDPARVSVRHGDTAVSPFGMGTFASRSMVMAGGAVARATRLLRAKIVRIAAQLLQCAPADVQVRDGRAVGPNGAASFAEVCHTAYLRQDGLPPGTEPMLDATATYEPAIATGVFCYSTHAAVVAVDAETGVVEILDYGVVEDCGTVVNPMIVDGQIAGGVAQGIGTALYEELRFEEAGQAQAAILTEYCLPGAVEIPDIKIVHMTTPSPHTEYGMKGMGEGGAIAPPAAIANAIRDALAPLGAEINETPITPRRLRAAIAVAEARRSSEGRGSN